MYVSVCRWPNKAVYPSLSLNWNCANGRDGASFQTNAEVTHTLGYTPKGEDEMRLNESSHVAIMYAT